MLTEKQMVFYEPDSFCQVARTFGDADHLLKVDYDYSGNILGFVLTCGLRSEEKQFMAWSQATGFQYRTWESGEASPLSHMSPLAGPSIEVPRDDLVRLIKSLAAEIDSEVREFICQSIRDSGGSH